MEKQASKQKQTNAALKTQKRFQHRVFKNRNNLIERKCWKGRTAYVR